MAIKTAQLVISLIDRLTAPARGVNAAIRDLTEGVRRNAAQMDAARGHMMDAVGAGYALAQGLSAPISAAMDFENALSDIKRVVDFDTPRGLADMGREIRRMAVEDIPMAADGIAAIVAAAGQSGIAAGELTEFAGMAAKVAVAWETAAGDTGEALAKLKTGLGLTLAETGLLADAINHLGNNSAASAPEILKVVRNVGPMGKQFGFTTEQVAALGAAMVGSGFEAEVASTSLLNVGRALTQGASGSARFRKAMQAIGKDSAKVAKDMQTDAVGTLKSVLEQIGKAPKHRQASLISDIFGDEARALGPLISNVELLDQVLGLVADKADYAGSAQREFAEASARTAANLQFAKNAVRDVAISIGGALLPAFNMILKEVRPVITSISELAQAYPKVTTAIVAGTAAVVGFRVAAAAAAWSGLYLKGGVMQMGLAALTAARGLAAIPKAIVFGPLVAGFRGLRAIIFDTGMAVAAAMKVLRVAMIGTGIGAVLLGIGAAGAFIYQNWSGIGVAFESFSSALTGALGPGTTAMISGVTDAVSGLIDWLWALTGPLSEETWSVWGAKAGLAVADVVNWFSGLPATLAALDWSTAGASLAAGVSDGLTGLAAMASDAASRLADAFFSVDWSGMGASALAGLQSGWSAVSTVAAGLRDGMASAFSSVDWSALGASVLAGLQSGWSAVSTEAAGLGERITAAVSSIDWAAVGASASAGVSGLYDHLTAQISSVDWGGIGETIGSLIGDVFASSFNLWSAVIDGLSGAGSGDASSALAGVGGTIASAVAATLRGFDWAGVGRSIVGYLGAGLDAAASFLAGVLRGLFGNISLQEAGVRLIESLKAGAVAAFETFLAWVRSIPSQIVAAIGRIDLSNIIRWPSMPSWLGGGGGAGTGGSPAIDGARAEGGPVRAGGTYLVGEEGPELFTPGRSGVISPFDVYRSTAGARTQDGTAAAPSSPAPPAPVSSTFNVSMQVTVQGETDLPRIARQLGRMLRDEMQGVQGDLNYAVGV